MPEIACRDDANEFTIDLLIGEDGNLRKARHPLILVIEHFEGAKPPAEGNLMLRLDMLIAKNQHRFFTKTSTISSKSFSSSSFDKSTPVMATPNLFDKACVFNGIDQPSFVYVDSKVVKSRFNLEHHFQIGPCKLYRIVQGIGFIYCTNRTMLCFDI